MIKKNKIIISSGYKSFYIDKVKELKAREALKYAFHITHSMKHNYLELIRITIPCIRGLLQNKNIN